MRSLFLFSVLALAAASQAGTYSVASHVDVTTSGDTHNNIGLEPVTSQTSLITLQNLHTDYTVFSPGHIGTGVWEASGYSSWSFSFDLAPTSTVGDTITYTGTWYATGANGSSPIVPSAVGSGPITMTVQPSPWAGNDYLTTTHLSGDLVYQVVPEPSSIAALGLGGLALLRRRRR